MVKDPMIPPERIVKVSAAGRLKQLAYREGRSTDPYFQKNPFNGNDEFIVEFYDNASGDKYRVIASQLGWERIITGLQKAFGKAKSTQSKQHT